MKTKLEPSLSELRTAEVDGDVQAFLVGLGYLKLDEGGILRLSDEMANLNMAICKRCGTFMLSTFVHDFESCGCEDEDHIYIDGGDEYCRFGGDPDNFLLPERVQEEDTE